MYFKGFDPHNGAIRLKSNDVAELGSARAKHPRDLLKKTRVHISKHLG